MNTDSRTAAADIAGSGTADIDVSDQGSPGLLMHTLYLGSTGGRGFDEVYLSKIGSALAADFGSFTMFPAVGFYRDKALPSLVIKIAAADTDTVRSTARKLGRMLEQEAVGLELGGRYHRIITE